MEESAAVESIKLNPKCFFKYVKRKRQVRTPIGPLLAGNRLTSDPAEMCEELLQQYDSVFSEPVDVTEQTLGSSDRNSNMEVMGDIVITEGDFIEAIKRSEPTQHLGKMACSTFQNLCVYFGMSL